MCDYLDENNPHILAEERMFLHNDAIPTAEELADYHRWLAQQSKDKKGSNQG